MPNQPINPEAIDETYTPQVRDDIAAVEIDGEMLLFDEAGSAWHLLNPTAAVVWQIVDGVAPVSELVQDISSAFGADLADVHAGVVAAVQDFGRRGLLVGVEPTVEDQPGHHHDHTTEQSVETPPPGEPRFIIDPPSS